MDTFWYKMKSLLRSRVTRVNVGTRKIGIVLSLKVNLLIRKDSILIIEHVLMLTLIKQDLALMILLSSVRVKWN